MATWGDDTIEVEPLIDGKEEVCDSCRLAFWSANKHCTNCDLWGLPMLQFEAAFHAVPALV